MFTKVFKIIVCHAVLVTLVMFSYDICRFSLKNMSMSLIKIYRTPTTTNKRLPTEQQNGYHGVATEQFIEGVDGVTGWTIPVRDIYELRIIIWWLLCLVCDECLKLKLSTVDKWRWIMVNGIPLGVIIPNQLTTSLCDLTIVMLVDT